MINSRCKVISIILVFFIFIFTLMSQSTYETTLNTPLNTNNQGSAHSSGQSTGEKQWLNNSDFSSNNSWYKSIDGDSNDVNASISGGMANYEILGNKTTYEFYSDLTQDSNWNLCRNPDFPAFPDFKEINSSGACVSHYWDEGPDQSVAANWNHTIEMPIEMSDYIISSATLQAVFNASVQAQESIDNYQGFPEDDPDDEYTGAIDVMSDSEVDTNWHGGYFTGSTGDYARYYVLLSDTENINVFEVASYQTNILGQDSPEIDHLDDTLMVSIPEETLIFYLTSILNQNYKNFTISIGIRIWCEDNFRQDADNWELLSIKSVNLTFCYEKRIDQLTRVSWNQYGKKLTDLNPNNYTVLSTEALVKFNYKIDKNWTTSTSSINSEIRVLLNGNDHPITINLNDVNTSFKEAVFNLNPPIESINFSIQIFLRDEFELDKTITISIDDVYLFISYIIIIPDPLDKNDSGDATKVIEESGLNWIILGILLVLLGILVIFFIQTYILIPRKRTKQVDLISRTQKFRDMTNIQAIILIHKLSGLPFFTRRYSILEEKHDGLFSGFIQAIIAISEEIQGSNLEETKSTKLSEKFKSPKLDLKSALEKIIELDFKYFYCLIADRKYFRFVYLLKNPASERLKKKVTDLLILLDNQYSEQMKNFDGNLTDLNFNLPKILDSFFALYYKDLFKLNRNQSYLLKIRKERKLTRLENQIIDIIKTNFKGKKQFRLRSILNLVKEEDKNLIIAAIEKLMELQIITRYISDYK